MVQPLAEARSYACAFTVSQAEQEPVLTDYFEAPKGYAWRAGFTEPKLDDVRGLGAKLLSFDKF
jgi:hypothetical protein